MSNENKVMSASEWYKENNIKRDNFFILAKAYAEYYHAAMSVAPPEDAGIDTFPKLTEKDRADIARHTVTKDGFNGIPVGGIAYSFGSGFINGIVLKEGDILNRFLYWFTDFEYKNLVNSLLSRHKVDLVNLRDDFFKECTNQGETFDCVVKVNVMPHFIFDWFKNRLSGVSDAVAFAEWCVKNKWSHNNQMMWKHESNFFPEGLLITTAELYALLKLQK